LTALHTALLTQVLGVVMFSVHQSMPVSLSRPVAAVFVLMQFTATLLALALTALPEPLLTLQVCQAGCAPDTLTS
jgi:hypothetical protein